MLLIFNPVSRSQSSKIEFLNVIANPGQPIGPDVIRNIWTSEKGGIGQKKTLEIKGLNVITS